jgi:hypothetical protein
VPIESATLEREPNPALIERSVHARLKIRSCPSKTE